MLTLKLNLLAYFILLKIIGVILTNNRNWREYTKNCASKIS